jgi:hypothetical protein
VLFLALGYAGWRSVRASSDESCSVCRRPIHASSRTVGVVAGKRAVFCCPACARSETLQASGVKITEMTDFLTGAKLAPERAVLVRGSDVNPCTMHAHAPLDEDKRAAEVRFDRCSPSLLAFSSRAEATRFMAEHGGTLVP